MSSSIPKAKASSTAVRDKGNADEELNQVKELLSFSDSEPETPSKSLRKLYGLQDSSESMRQEWLKVLGSDSKPPDRRGQRNIAGMHEEIALYQYKEFAETDYEILSKLLEYNDQLKNLFAQGQDGLTILHVILDRETYEADTYADVPFNFDRVKPLIRFLIRLHPDLPAIESEAGKGTPIFMALKKTPNSERETANPSVQAFTSQEKEDIVKFMCEEVGGGLGSRAAIKSLGQMVYSNGGNDQSHAIHTAIELSDITISEEVVKALCGISIPNTQDKNASKLCLEMCDGQGRTCLHIALLAPFTPRKIWWAEKLAELRPNLLKATCTIKNKDGKAEKLTPLQIFTEQKIVKGKDIKNETDESIQKLTSKLEQLEAFLKRQCLVSFDNNTCSHIMYKETDMKEIFLTLDDETVTWKFLQSQRQHYKLDTSLKRVHVFDTVSIRWDDESTKVHNIAKEWGCAGNFDLFMIFYWLRTEIAVKKIVEVVVDDGAVYMKTIHDLPSPMKKPHSDQAIIQCISGLSVENLDWRRADIPAQVFVEVEAEQSSIRTLYLYCSGLKAVLQSWADRQGLARLRNLRTVYVEIDQGLESKKMIHRYARDFMEDLQKTWRDLNPDKKPLTIQWKPAARQTTHGDESSASKLKSKNEHGFEEQDWLKCMDEFAEIMEAVEKSSNVMKAPRPPKVALIDDGVKTSYAGLDYNVCAGKSGWQLVDLDHTQAQRTLRNVYRNYNYSYTGHGTVMAYYIKRVCPKVQLYVAKLDPEPQQADNGNGGRKITFSRQSAIKAIEWAVEQDVDIISMSWAIDNNGNRDENQGLRDAIKKATDRNILLFCANPDKGPGYTNNDTYPKNGSNDVFCIGAATQAGVSWGQIDSQDKSCDYFLPGVELGIQVDTASRKFQDEPPREWRMHSGSSLSCALAAGLAAMILHCSLVTGAVTLDSWEWQWLRSHKGMRNAFKNIQIEHSTSGWLPVRRFFSSAVEQLEGDTEDKVNAVQKITQKLKVGIPPPELESKSEF